MSKQKTTEIPLPQKLYKALEKFGKERGMTPDEFALELLRSQMLKHNLMDVTIKVPKLLMKVLEEQKYFGWTKEQFFVEAVKSGIGIATSNMDHDEMMKFYRKYGKNIDVTRLPDGFETYVVTL